MAKKKQISLDKKQLKELEDLFKERLEYIVFNHERPSGEAKVGSGKTKKRPGGYKKDALIEDNSHKLRNSIKRNKGFIKQDSKGLSIDIRVIEYFKYLDDGRANRLNWYLTEAFFEDKEIRDKLRELYIETGKRAILDIVNKMKDELES